MERAPARTVPGEGVNKTADQPCIGTRRVSCRTRIAIVRVMFFVFTNTTARGSARQRVTHLFLFINKYGQ